MRDGAKEFFVKRMPKEFESEFNMPASMFRDHLLFFGNSVGSRSRLYEGPTVPLTIQISIHSHCTALGLDRDPCPLVECYIVWEPNGLLSVGMNAQNRNTLMSKCNSKPLTFFYWHVMCVEAFQRSGHACTVCESTPLV